MAATLSASIDTAATLFALAGTVLLGAAYVASRRTTDLGLVTGFAVMALISLANALLATLHLRTGARFTGATLCAHLIAAGLLVAAGRRGGVLVDRRRTILVSAVTALAATVLIGLGGLALGGDLAAGDPHSGVGGNPAGIVAIALASGLFAIAAGATLARRNERRHAISALAMAEALLSAAALGPLVPGAARDVAPADALTLVAFVLVFVAGLRYELGVRARLTGAGALAERRRVAADLHDGLAQDLAVIAAHGAQLVDALGAEHAVVVAARRALALSRSTIAELSDPAAMTTRQALDAVAHELRQRFPIMIQVDVDLDQELAPGAREHVSRIAREAIVNAARHGGARTVVLQLRQADGRIALRIVDDGRGLIAGSQSVDRQGFGLTSMRERAVALGGLLRVRDSPGGGTELEVVVS